MNERESMPTGYLREDYVRRRPRMLPLVLLFALLLPAALFATAHMPQQDADVQEIRRLAGYEDRGAPVLGLMDIEDAWAIEDERTEAETPLVSRMYNDDAALGFDRESRTFYCTLGLDHPEDWPQVALSAAGEEGLSVAWIDDYTYDFCSDAIEEGYRYELLAYTDTQFEYIGLVFTGLPIVTLHADGDAPIVMGEDVGADVHISSAQDDAIFSRALVHRRGGGAYVGVPKHSYRFEFRGVDARGGEGRIARSVLGMEADSDWLLIANSSDYTAIRNHLCWQLWGEWTQERQIAELESHLVEVFVGDEYVGLYQLMQYVDPEKEIRLMGGNPETDAMMRMVTISNSGRRPQMDRVDWDTHRVELRHAPEGMTPAEAFALFEPFNLMEIKMTYDLSDEEYTALVEKHLDIEHMLSYFLFVQAYNLRDNAINNVYVWALRQEDGSFQYRISPWDMDRSLCKNEREGVLTEEDIVSWELRMTARILELDIGSSRQMLWDMYRQKRSTMLSDDAIYQFVLEAEEMVNASGAYLRESEKWRGGGEKLDLGWMRAALISLQSTVEYHMREIWCGADIVQR